MYREMQYCAAVFLVLAKKSHYVTVSRGVIITAT
jgi:hypothetical protein